MMARAILTKFNNYFCFSAFPDICILGSDDRRRSRATAMIQINKLVRFRDVADDIEFADGLVLRGPKRYSSGRVAFAVQRVFRP